MNSFIRTEMLIGSENLTKLKNSHVAVFGVGGVGSYVIDALARSSISKLTLIDNDTVSITNINRQLIALNSTIGKFKTDVAKQRILDINPHAIVNIFNIFYTKHTIDKLDYKSFDYIVDAIDTVSSKLLLAEISCKFNIPIISSMGTGNKLNPTMLEVTDIFKTSVCPLAKVIRHELRKRNIHKLKVVYSKEEPLKPLINYEEPNSNKRQTPGSISFVPSVAGLIIASEVVKDILKGATICD